MSLLPRALQKIFGQSGGASEFGQIGSKAAGSPATTKNLETMQSLTEYLQGLNAIVSDQGTSVLPYLEDINSLFFLMTSQLAYLMQAGIPEWNDETEYYLNVSLVLYDGEIYVDTFGTPGTPNLDFDPGTNPTKWRAITGGRLLVTENLDDLGNKATARTNLDVYNKSESDDVVSTHAALTSTHGASSDIVGKDEIQTLTNKTISGDNNTITEVGSIKDSSGTYTLREKVIVLNAWNMDLLSSLTMPHGLTLANIIQVSVMIISDAGDSLHNLNSFNSGATMNGTYNINTTHVELYRETGGQFDSTDYDSLASSRGWMVIKHKI